jgi:hypothetical protein
VLLDFFHAHARDKVSPESNDAGSQTVVREVLDAHVGHIEICRVDALEVAIPWEPSLIGSALIEGFHIGIEAGHNLHNCESLLDSICRERFKAVGPTEPFAQSHPPGIA